MSLSHDVAWQGPFTEGLLPAELYDGTEITEQRVMYYDKVVGGVRLRQSRIRGDSCDIGLSVQEWNTATGAAELASAKFDELFLGRAM